MTGGLNSETLSAGENSKEILKKYINIALNETSIFFTTKLEFISATLGIKKSLGVWEWDYNRFDRMSEFNFSDTIQRHCFINVYSSFLEKVEMLRKPWLMFLLSLSILILKPIIVSVKNENKAKTRKISIEGGIFLVAFFYYAAFLINNQSMEFRYFYPSCYLLLILDISVIIELVSILGEKVIISLNKGEHEKNEISNI